MKKVFVYAIALLLATTSFSQGVGINTTGAAANSNAMLDVASTNKGVLIPRMTSAERKAIPVTANDIGMLVFDKEKQRLYMFDGTKWIPFAMEVSGGITSQGTTINANPESKPEFAYSTAVDGNYAVIGCPRDSLNGIANAGSARVFQNQAGHWEQVAQLTPGLPYPNAQFGRCVAISGDFIVVGAPAQQFNIPNTNSYATGGIIYIYHRSGNNWQLQQKFFDNTPTNDERFGISIDIEDSTIVVGAPGTASFGAQIVGSAFIYSKNGNSWQLETELVPSDGTSPGEFGNSVSLSGNVIACGSPYADNTSQGIQNCGAVYLFTEAHGVWAQTQKIYSSWITADAHFGELVSLNGNRLLAGNGLADCELFGKTAFNWIYLDRLFHPGIAPGEYGEQLLLHDDYVFISSILENVNGMDKAGVVYIFKKDADGKYNFFKRLTDTDPFFYNGFGTGLGFDGTTLIVGSPGSSGHLMRGGVSFFDVGD